jgi:hypothetical protein
MLDESADVIACGAETTKRQVEIWVTDSTAPISPGTYLVGPQLSPNTGPAVTWVEYPITGGQSTDYRLGVSGTITLTSVTAQRVQGSFSATMQRDDGSGMTQLSGTFDAPTAPCQ